jgi:hypothetical protein
MRLRLFIAAALIAASGLMSVVGHRAPSIAAQRKEVPLPCPPVCPVLKQDLAWIQHRVAGDLD